jgi:hypothetical protein
MSELTKHYYVVEEVKVALAYACKNKNQEEAYFWCNELCVSGMNEIAKTVLFDTWLWTYGPCRLFWFDCMRTCDMDRLPRLACFLAALDKEAQDSSLWVILKETKEQPDRVIRSMTCSAHEASPLADRVSRSTQDATTELASYFLASVKENKSACAWWAASQLGLDTTYELVKLARPERILYINVIISYSPPGYDSAILCLIACIASMWDELWISSIQPIPLKSVKDIVMKKHTRPREARVYEIPHIALYGQTKRGRMKQSESTLNEIRDIESSLKGIYWTNKLYDCNSKLCKKTGRVIWSSDEVQEEFYETHFPDDIPDEWPLREQLKSHGNGVLGESEIICQDKLARIWLPRRQRLTWQKITEEPVGSLSEMASSTTPIVSETDVLVPVMKKLTIQSSP